MDNQTIYYLVGVSLLLEAAASNRSKAIVHVKKSLHRFIPIIIAVALISILFIAVISCDDSSQPAQSILSEANPAPSTQTEDTAIPLTSIMASQVVPPVSSNQQLTLIDWTLSNLFTIPAEPKAGQQVEVWTIIYITYPMESPIEARLLVNQKVVAQRNRIIWLDEQVPLSFSFIPDGPGTYDLEIQVTLEPANKLVQWFGGSGNYITAYGKLVVMP
jgi:hypothetical protein